MSRMSTERLDPATPAAGVPMLNRLGRRGGRGRGRSVSALPQLPSRLPRRINWWQLLLAALLLLGCFRVGYGMAMNKNFGWSTVGSNLFAHNVIKGVRVTLELTVIAQVVALLGGTALALMTQSHNVVIRWIAWAYIWFFRGTPLLVQLIFWFNLALLLPHVHIYVPLIVNHTWDTNQVISPFGAAVIGLSLNEVAYMSEIIRGGILGVPKGQIDAALSVGASHGLAMRRIVLPQTVRIVVPPAGNQFIGLLKTSSLVSVIGGGDLLTQVQRIYGSNFEVIPLLTVACLWFLAMTTVATAMQHVLERSLAR